MRLRMKADMTQRAFGEKAGVGIVTIVNAEAGKNLQPLIAQRIANALEVDVDELAVPDIPTPLTAKGEADLVREVKESSEALNGTEA